MKHILTALALLGALTSWAGKPVEMDLWPQGAPGDNGVAQPEATDKDGNISFISCPMLTVYPADKPNGLAVVACPGGAYRMQSPKSAHDMARWFNERGITLAVLKYRIPNIGHTDVTVGDGLQAMKLVKSLGKEYGYDRVGVMGASAGGHLASTIATHYDAGSRPDFQILIYPVITMDSTYTHRNTRINLLGRTPAPQSVEAYSNEMQVPADAPQAFIAACWDDRVVPVRNSIEYFTALRSKGIPAALHVWPNGNHGWGYGDDENFLYNHEFRTELDAWLNREVLPGK